MIIFGVFVFRVCKRWNILVKNGWLWKTINITWCYKFPRDPSLVLNFLQTYTGNCTHSVHLPHLNNEILRHLQRHCTNLRSLKADVTGSVDMALLPGSLKDLHLAWCWKTSMPGGSSPYEKVTTSSNCMSRFESSYLSQLQRLTLTNMVFSPKLFQYLSNCSSLDHLHIDNCYGVTESGLQMLANCVSNLKSFWIEMCANGVTNNDLQVILHQVARNAKNLSNLKVTYVTIHSLANVEQFVDGELFLNDLSTSCTNLRHLQIQGITGISSQGITGVLYQCGVYLESLTLKWCGPITDEIIGAIFKYGRNLKRVELLPLTITDTGLEALLGHSTIENLKLNYCQNMGLSLSKVLQTMVTLPELKCAEVTIYQPLLEVSQDEVDAVQQRMSNLTIDVHKYGVRIGRK